MRLICAPPQKIISRVSEPMSANTPAFVRIQRAFSEIVLVLLGGLLLFLIRLVVGLVLLIIHIVAMLKANQGQMWKLPVIGDIAEKNA